MNHRQTRATPEIIGLVLILVFGLASAAVAQEAVLNLKEWETVIAGIGKAQAVKTPKELLKFKCHVMPGMYSPQKILDACPRLALEEGYELDFIYDYQDLGAHPVLYARKTADWPFYTKEAFRKAYPRNYFLGDDIRYNPAYLPHVRTDDTPDGFLQLATLVQLGEQFFIHWHAIYSVVGIITDRQTVAAIAARLPPEVASKTLSLDPKPRVVMEKDRVTVEFVIYGEFSGFTRVEWIVKRAFPHTLITCTKNVLVPWRNPIRF